MTSNHRLASCLFEGRVTYHIDDGSIAVSSIDGGLSCRLRVST